MKAPRPLGGGPGRVARVGKSVAPERAATVILGRLAGSWTPTRPGRWNLSRCMCGQLVWTSVEQWAHPARVGERSMHVACLLCAGEWPADHTIGVDSELLKAEERAA